MTPGYTCGAGGLISEHTYYPGKSLWYHYGPQGETRQLTNTAQQVVDTYTYTAYGELKASTGTDPNPFRFGGQVGYYTPITSTGAVWTPGLAWCGSRWYNPQIGRWLSRDPVGYAGGPNLFEYCGSDPVNLVDADGTRPMTPQETDLLRRLYHFHGTVPTSAINGAVAGVKGYIAGLPVGRPDPVNLKALMWAIGQLGNHNYGRNAYHTDPNMQNVPVGQWKCNIFIADAYVQGGGVPAANITRWQFGFQKQPYGANWLGDAGNRQDYLPVAHNPLPGYMFALRAMDESEEHGHPGLYLSNDVLIYAGRYEVQLGLISVNQAGHKPIVFRYYRP